MNMTVPSDTEAVDIVRRLKVWTIGGEQALAGFGIRFMREALAATQEQRGETWRPAEALKWAIETFGSVAGLRSERTLRFIEEAIELGHALGLEACTLKVIADRVYSREPGDVPREIGQAQMTLECLAENIGHSAQDEAAKEFERVKSIPPTEWERRHSAKVAIGMALQSPELLSSSERDAQS